MAQADEALSGTVTAAGTATLTFRTYGRAVAVVQQVGIEADDDIGAASLGMIRKNGSPITPFLTSGDAPAGEPYVTIRGSDRMTIEWTGATPGANVRATVLYDDGT